MNNKSNSILKRRQGKLLPTVPLTCENSMVKAGGSLVTTKDTLNNQYVNSNIIQPQKLAVHHEDVPTIDTKNVSDTHKLKVTLMDIKRDKGINKCDDMSNKKELIPKNNEKIKKGQANLFDRRKNKLPVTTRKTVLNKNNTSKIPDKSMNNCLLNKPIELKSENTEKSLELPIKQESDNNIEPERLLKLAPYPILDTDPTLGNVKMSLPLSRPHLIGNKIIDNGTQSIPEIEPSNRNNESFQHYNSRKQDKNKNNSNQNDLKSVDQTNKTANDKHDKILRQPPGHRVRKLLQTISPKPLNSDNPIVKAGGSLVTTNGTLNNKDVISKNIKPQKLAVHQDDVPTIIKKHVSNTNKLNVTLLNIKGDKENNKSNNISNKNELIPESNNKFKKEQANLLDKNKNKLTVTKKKRVVNTNNTSKIPDNSLNKCLLNKPKEMTSESTEKCLKSPIEQESNNNNIEPERLLKLAPYPILDTDPTLDIKNLSTPLLKPHLSGKKIIDYGTHVMHEIEQSNRHNKLLKLHNSGMLEKTINNSKQNDLKTINQPNYTANEKQDKLVRKSHSHRQRKQLQTISPKPLNSENSMVKAGGSLVTTIDTLNNQNVNSNIIRHQKLAVHHDVVPTIDTKHVSDTHKLKVTLMNIKGDKGNNKCDNMSNTNELIPKNNEKFKKDQANLFDRNKNKLTVTTRKRVINTDNASKIPDNSLNKWLLNKPIELTSENTERSLKSPIKQESSNNIEPERLSKLSPNTNLDIEPTLGNVELSVPVSKPNLIDNGTQSIPEIEPSNRNNESFQHYNSRKQEKNKNNSKQKDLKSVDQTNKTANDKHDKILRQPPGHRVRKLLPEVPPKPLNSDNPIVKAGGSLVTTNGTLNNKDVISKNIKPQKLAVHQDDVSTVDKKHVSNTNKLNVTLMNIKGDKGIKKCDNKSNINELIPKNNDKCKKEQANLLDKNKNKLTVAKRKRVVNTDNASKIPDNSLNKCLLIKPIEMTSENTEKSLESPIKQESNNNIEPERLLKLAPYPILDTDPTLDIYKLSAPPVTPDLSGTKVVDYGTQIMHEIETSNRHNKVFEYNNIKSLENNKKNSKQKNLKTTNQPNNKTNIKHNQHIKLPTGHRQRNLLPIVPPKLINFKNMLKASIISQKCFKSSIPAKKKVLPNLIYKETIKFPYYKTFPVTSQEKKYVQHSAIRSSLFSNVSPYIRFSSYDVKGQPFPLCLQKLLKWKLTSVTPAIVRRCIENTGFKLVRSEPIDFDPIVITNYSNQNIISLQRSCGVTPPVVDLPWKPNSPNNDLPRALPHDWVGTWGRHMYSVHFKRLCDQHKLNHIPGTFQIGRKDRLWVNLQKFILKYGINEFGFIPTTYVLPQDIKKLREVWDKNDNEIKWIIKPPAAARGSGIRVISKWCQIPKRVPLIVQSYIENPYLINDTKFDLRIYVLVTSISPLKIYLYDNGLVRFASVKYSSDFATLSDRYMHLTNYSINRFNTQYTANEDVNACHGHKWTLKSLWAYLKKERNVNVDKIWKSLIDLVVKTIISGESPISQMCQSYLGNRYNSYELFGIDVLFDEYLKPWILEVNISPSLHSTSELDKAVKGSLIQDLMNVVGYHIPNNMSPSTHSTLLKLLGIDPPLCYDSRLYTLNLSAKEREKHEYYNKIKTRQEYINTILLDLMPDDVRHLITYEDELTQLGSFQKVFPTTSTFKYHQYFNGPRYYNMLFDAWEHKYSGKREEGIAVLEKLCLSKVHLEVVQDIVVE